MPLTNHISNALFSKARHLVGLFFFLLLIFHSIEISITLADSRGDFIQYELVENSDHRDFSSAYLVIAGPGRGLGAFGHAFLIFCSKPGDIFHGLSFQYNILIEQNESLLKSSAIEKLLAVQHSPFLLKVEPSQKTLEHYQNEERSQFVYKIDFSATEVQQLYENLTLDDKRRKLERPVDYSIISRNCYTRLVEEINKVLVTEDPRRIDTAWSESNGFLWRKIFNRDAVGGNTPLFAPLGLRKTKLVDPSKMILIRPSAFIEIEKTLSYLNEIENLAKGCAWTEEKMNFVNTLLSNKKTRRSYEVWTYLIEKWKFCLSNQSHPKDDYLRMSQSIRKLIGMILFEAEDPRLEELVLQTLKGLP